MSSALKWKDDPNDGDELRSIGSWKGIRLFEVRSFRTPVLNDTAECFELLETFSGEDEDFGKKYFVSINSAKDFADKRFNKVFGIKSNKFNAVRTEVDGLKFHSKLEARRYGQLRLEEMAGEIIGLQRQVMFVLTVNDVKIATYVADFTYNRMGEFVVEDTKSEVTRKLESYRMKKALMLALFQTRISEVL